MTEEIVIQIQVAVDKDAPTYSKYGDAGLDLKAQEDFSLRPGQYASVPTGIRIAIPYGYAGLLLPRSGNALKKGMTILNSPGLIDSGYRGEIDVIIQNLGMQPFDIQEGDRIAQLVIIPVPQIFFEKVYRLPDSDRGYDGFGSTGD